MSALGVAGIRVAFGDTVALDDVSLDVPFGRVTAVVGGDGAGKSTLLRVFAGLVGVRAGEVRTLGRADIGYQPSTSGVWGGLTVAENVEFVGRSCRMPADLVRTRAEALLTAAGLSAATDRLGRELSGGMRQKLGFVLAILHEPRLVLLDEPSTGVDPVSRVELWRLIAEAAAGGTAVLMATTYLDEAARAATVMALDDGVTIGSGTPDEIIASVPGRIVNTDHGDASPDSWSRGPERHRWIRPGADASRAVGSPIRPDLEDALIALTLARDEPHDDGRPHERALARTRTRTQPHTQATGRPALPVAEGRGITRRFGSHVAVDDVSVSVSAGEIVGLIGANGAGKTTFLRTLIGLERPDGGEALLFGAPPDAASRGRLGYVPQSLGLYRTITVAENAEFFARVYRMPRPTLPPSLASVSDRPVSSIGLGRQRRLAFALALAHHPELLVLDEPTSGVEPLSRARLWDTIHAQADAGAGVIVTTHYLQEAEVLSLAEHPRQSGLSRTSCRGSDACCSPPRSPRCTSP